MIFTRDVKARWNNMRVGVDTQAEFLLTEPRSLFRDITQKLEGPCPSKLYLVGCGDSFFASLAGRMAIENWTKISVEALESLEFSRYAIRMAPQDSMVVAVSNSGEVARTVECLYYAKELGMRTISVTNNPNGRLAKAADLQLVYQAPRLPPPPAVGWGPGTVSYIASAISLLVIGLRLGELSGKVTLSEIESVLHQFAGMADATRQTIALSEPPSRFLGNQIKPDDLVMFLGGGPNYATALFAMAKWIEASRSNAVGQQLEEWAHEQYFCCRSGTYTVVFAPPGASIDRAREQLTAVNEVGGWSVAVCDASDELTARIARTVLPVQGLGNELLSPLLYCIPASLLAYHFCMGNESIRQNYEDDEHRYSITPRLIHKSNIPEHIPPLE